MPVINFTQELEKVLPLEITVPKMDEGRSFERGGTKGAMYIMYILRSIEFLNKIGAPLCQNKETGGEGLHPLLRKAA